MIITKKALDRRTVLRGLGASVALPLLDGMVPALTPVRLTAAAPVIRMGIVYVPHGAPMDRWTPAGTGAAFEFSPSLEPLAAFRDRLIILTGLDCQPAAQVLGDPGGGHGRIGGAWLTGVHPKPTEGADYRAGTSLDQIAASQVGRETELASLEVGLGSTDLAGACDAGYSCAYTSTLCWRNATSPMPMESDPRALFERLFGDGDSRDPAARLARTVRDRSILDSVRHKVADLQTGLGTRDRAKLAAYLEGVRDIEQRIQKAETHSARALAVAEAPSAGVPVAFEDYAKLMFDLQLVAYQTDKTRIITFMLTPELSTRSYPEVGVAEGHHGLSHHQGRPESLAKLAKVNAFHTRLFSYYLGRLKATPDGEGSLLDHSMILYGSGMSNSDVHDPHNLPILLAGGGAGQLKGGRHLRVPDGTPLTNLYMTMLNKLGVRVERFGDSTGEIREVSGV